MRTLKKLLFFSPLFLLFFTKTNAQIVSNNAFIKGNYVEIGINPYGVYGSSINAPTGYHPRLDSPSSFNLGFVADPDKDGWNIGIPNYHGDFFYPGVPQEGFSIQFNGLNHRNWNSGTFDISGNNISITSDATGETAIWEGTINGMHIVQKTFAPINEVFFVIRIELTNTTSAIMTDAYYMRTLDPDNDVTLSDDYTTYNEVVFDLPNVDNNTLVSATGLYYPDAYLGLGTRDCRANSFILNNSLTPSYSALTATYYNETATDATYTGNYTNDVGIGITFDLGDIAPGETKKFAYTYILNVNDLNIALAQTQPEVFANATTPVIDGDTYVFCEGEAVTFTVNNGEEYDWSWEPQEFFSSPYGDAVTLTTPGDTTVFTVTGNSDCNPVSYSFTISPSTFQSDLNDVLHTVCNNQSSSYNPLSGVTSPTSTINWYDSPTGGSIIATTPTFTTPVLTNTTSTPIEYTYYYEETTAQGCVSPRIPYTVEVYSSLDLPNAVLKQCESGSTATFNLLDYENLIEPINNATFTYFASITDFNNNTPIADPSTFVNTTNNQIVYVNVEVNSTCSDLVEITLEVYEPITATPATLTGCDDNFDGIATFDLSEAESQINTDSGIQFAYYLTEINAINEVNEITNFNNYDNIVNPQTLYVRVFNDNCYTITTLLIDVKDKPVLNNGVLEECEENVTGTANFNLNDAITQFSSDTTLTYNFATSVSNLDNGIYITDITNYTNTLNPQIIYVEATNGFGCSTIAELTLNVSPIVRYTVSDFDLCDDDGYATFDLSTKESEMLAVLPVGSYTFSYYTSESDALNGTSPISATSFTNTITPEQTIYVRAETTGSCPGIISFKLVINLNPTISVSSNNSICEGSDAIFTFVGTPNATVDYTLNGNPNSLTLNASGTYTLTEISPSVGNVTVVLQNVTNTTNLCSVSVSDTSTVVVNILPTASIDMASHMVCPNGTTTLTFTGTPNAEVTFTDGTNNYTVTLDASGTVDFTTPMLTVDTTFSLVDVTLSATDCSQTISDSETIVISPIPEITNINYDSEICEGTSPNVVVTLNDSSAGYTWVATLSNIDAATVNQTGDQTDINQIFNLQNPLIPGYVTIEIQPGSIIGNCAGAVETIQIKINPVPEITNIVESSTGICNNETVHFELSGEPSGLEYQWTAILTDVMTDDGVTSGTITSNELELTIVLVNPNTQGSFYVEFTPVLDSCVGTTVSSEVITVNPIPGSVVASPTIPICSGDTAANAFDINLNFPLIVDTSVEWVVFDSSGVSGATDGSSATTPFEINDILTATGSTPGYVTYRIWTISPAGCQGDYVDFTVVVNPNPMPVLQGGSICVDGSGATFQSFWLQASGNFTANSEFVWYEASDTTNPIAITTIPQLEIFDIGSYYVEVTNQDTNCTGTSNAVPVVATSPATLVETTVTDYFSDNATVIVTATVDNGYLLYQMDEGGYQDSNVFTGVSSGEHTVEVIDSQGCTYLTTTVMVIDYPKYFTPNGDGYNDTWNITGLNQPDAKLYIFDRYGKLLKQISATDASNGWDGTYNGNQMPSTDYWFSLQYTENNVAKEFKAHFALKR